MSPGSPPSRAASVPDMTSAVRGPSRPYLYDCMHAHKDYESEAGRLLDLAGHAPVRCLDIGCGTGRHAVALVKAGATAVTGVDPDGDLVEAAAARALASGVSAATTFQIGRVEAADPGPYDLVTLLFNVVNYLPSPDALAELFRHVATFDPRIVAFDAWAPRASGQSDITRASRPFDCDGTRLIVDTTLRFDEAGPGSCGMQRSVRLPNEDHGQVVEAVLLSVWPQEVLARAASDAGFAVTVTTWSALLGTDHGPTDPEPLLFVCRPVEPGTSPSPTGGTT